MEKRLLHFLFCAALAALFSCEQEEAADNYEATITIQDSSLEVGATEGSTVKVIFTCDHEWSLEMPDDASWLTPDKTSGKTKKSLSITFTAAENNGDSRSASCKIVSGASSKKFTVTQAQATLVLKASDVQDLDKYYKPREFDFDMLRSDSKWAWCRSKQSEHFVVFWDKKYGEYGLWGETMGKENTSPTTCKSSTMQVDIDDLLKKAEEFYDLNVNKLKFADTGKGLSVLDKYKMEIYLLYQKDWLATGSGYDNAIGALWVNPATCKPVGSTIGHEIGHCFQYMVFCDYLLRSGISGNAAYSADGNQGPGWRYGFASGGAGGNCFWEQTAQWQSFQIEKYRAEAFSGWYGEYTSSANLHVLHERSRYGAYFIHWWWVEENHDISFIGRLWNSAVYPEDPVETYMRLMGYDAAAMNDSMWEYAAHMITYDTDEIRSYGKNYIGRQAVSKISLVDDWWAIDASVAPESTGSNSIRMDISAGSEISVTLASNLGLSGCVSGSASVAGWRYGFVSYNSDGSRTYSPVWSTTDTRQSWTVPSNASKVWFVVTGAPAQYERHAWGSGGSDHDNEGDSQDAKWPWKAQFENTKPYGK